MKAAEWVIPSGRTKNKHPHLVHLSPLAIDILSSIEPDAKKRKGYILTTDGETAIAGFSKAKAKLDVEIAAAIAKADKSDGVEPTGQIRQMEHWVYHDLRRTLATGCQGMGVALDHTEAVLNHRSGTRGGIAGVYQLYEYRTEKRAALELWGAHVAGVIKDGAEV
jgi:integrase